MVVDHSDRLHVGIANRGADKFKASLLQVLAHCIALLRAGGDLFGCLEFVLYRFAIDKSPDVIVERIEFVLHFQETSSIVSRAKDFQSIANNTRILEQLFQLLVGVLRDLSIVEV